MNLFPYVLRVLWFQDLTFSCLGPSYFCCFYYIIVSIIIISTNAIYKRFLPLMWKIKSLLLSILI